MKSICKVFKSIFFLLLTFIYGCSSDESFITATKKPIMEAVYASGIVHAQGEFEIWSQAEGTLVKQLANEGESIRKGDVLFIIKSERQSANLDDANRLYAQALKNQSKESPILNEAFHTLAQSKTKYDADSINFYRFKSLNETGATTQANFDLAQNTFSISKSAYFKSQQTLEQLRDKLANDLAQASNQRKIADEEQANFLIQSTIDGVFYYSNKLPGEFVRKGELLAILGSETAYIAKMRVDEQDILRLKVGQKVLIKIDAYPGKLYEAKLDKVYAKIDPRDQSLQADAIFIEPLPAKFTGMAIEANIIIRDKTEALVIPVNYLMPGDSLRILLNGKESKVGIEVGIRTLNEAEVINGINEVTRIVKP